MNYIWQRCIPLKRVGRSSLALNPARTLEARHFDPKWDKASCCLAFSNFVRHTSHAAGNRISATWVSRTFPNKGDEPALWKSWSSFPRKYYETAYIPPSVCWTASYRTSLCGVGGLFTGALRKPNPTATKMTFIFVQHVATTEKKQDTDLRGKYPASARR